MIVIKRNFCLGTPPTERLERDVLSGIVRPRAGAFWSSGLKRWRPVRTEIDKTTKRSRIRDQDTQADRRASEWVSEWQTERQAVRQRGKQAGRQTQRQAERQRDRQAGGQVSRQAHRPTGRQRNRHAGRQTGRRTDNKQTDWLTKWRAKRQTGRQTGRPAVNEAREKISCTGNSIYLWSDKNTIVRLIYTFLTDQATSKILTSRRAIWVFMGQICKQQ